ncbi:MAG: outer membrane lipoprotein LolB [Gammaproteobacteria bacterium]|nr:outer membrane lipoprotein LolB [Gammaproteobacteria bacterium]MYK83428.1 outer membrane lipoprotein LolB [Gammaproteobacteria bacterium]
MFPPKLLFLNAIFVALWLLAGCVSVPPISPGTDFSIKGKIGVVDGGESWSARFVWRQSGERFEIDLWGPLGQGQTRLRGTPDRLEITDADGDVRTSGSPEALMLAELGWSLPLSLLLDWLQGRPSVKAPVAEATSDPEGNLTGFRQLGWQVRFERAKQAPADAPPRRITAEKPGYRVRVAVSESGT